MKASWMPLKEVLLEGVCKQAHSKRSISGCWAWRTTWRQKGCPSFPPLLIGYSAPPSKLLQNQLLQVMHRLLSGFTGQPPRSPTALELIEPNSNRPCPQVMYRFLSEFTGLPEEQVEMECGEFRLTKHACAFECVRVRL